MSTAPAEAFSDGDPLSNPRRTHVFRRDPRLGRYVCAECVFGEFHRVHQLPDVAPDTRYERPDEP